MSQLLAYHGDPKVKAKYLARVRAHRKADELVQGVGFERNGETRGCAVGCTLDAYDHARYPVELGMPEMLARLEDAIFEGLPKAKALEWPTQFLSAAKPGADLSLVGWKFLAWLLSDEKVNPGINHPLVRDAVKRCANMMHDMGEGKKVAESARSAAESAARSAAWSAAESAAWSAESAAWSAARSAAWSAAWSAEAAAESAARSAARSAESAAYVLMSKKLLTLMRAAPVSR